MDPTANLKEQLTLSDEIKSLMDKETEEDQKIYEKAERLAQLVSDLHHWIIRGGTLPDQWRKS